MSNLIYEGDIVANFGKYLPTPYIETIKIGDSSEGNISISLSLYVNIDASQYTDDETFKNQLQQIKFYWMWGTELLEDNAFIFDFALPDGSNVFSFDLAGADAVDSGQIVYDAEGNRIIKYIYTAEYVSDDTTWGDIDDFYIYAFSTSEDLVEEYWNSVETDIPSIDIDVHWQELLKAEMSDIAYEQVMENGAVPDPIETIWVDINDAAYAETPLQAITSLYYKPEKVTHEEIVESFQELLAEYQEKAQTNSNLLDVTNNISLILENYGDQVDLLSRLNHFRRAYPNKSSTTPRGRLYAKYRKKIYTANAAVELGEQLFKKVVQSSKIVDTRGYETGVYEPPLTTEVCYSDCYDDCELVSNFTFNRQAFEWISGEEGEFTSSTGIFYDYAYGVNYGFFFFDYDKALTYLAQAASVINIGKIRQLWGEDIFNLNFKLDKVTLSRHTNEADIPGDLGNHVYMTMTAPYSYTSGYPILSSRGMEHIYYGDDEAVGYQEVSASPALSLTAGPADETYCTARSFLTLRNFDTATGDGVGLDGYRLMCFEFQDIMGKEFIDMSVGTGDVIGDLFYEYTATVTIEDTTLEAVVALLEVFDDFVSEFNEYYQVANEACSYNMMDGVFNDFFINDMAEKYPDLSSAPWVRVATVYYLYRDLLDDIFNGDINLIMLNAKIIADSISPSNGTLEQLEAFKELLDDLSEDIDAFRALVDDSGTVITKEFTCTGDIGGKGLYGQDSEFTACDLITADVEYYDPEPRDLPDCFEEGERILNASWLEEWNESYDGGVLFDNLTFESAVTYLASGTDFTAELLAIDWAMEYPAAAMLKAYEKLKELADTSGECASEDKDALHGGRYPETTTGIEEKVIHEQYGQVDVIWYNLWGDALEQYFANWYFVYNECGGTVESDGTVAKLDETAWHGLAEEFDDSILGGVDVKLELAKIAGSWHILCGYEEGDVGPMGDFGVITDADLAVREDYETVTDAWNNIQPVLQKLIENYRFPIWYPSLDEDNDNTGPLY